MAADDGWGPIPLGIVCEKLAKNGDSDRFMCRTEVQLVVKRPNAFGRRTNIATT